MPNRFKPNALLILGQGRPVLLKRLNSTEAAVVVSSIGLNWNTTKDKEFHDDYRQLFNYLAGKLPKERMFKGGIFYAYEHSGKRVPWEAEGSRGVAAIIYGSLGKHSGFCVKNTIITVGGYAGYELKPVTLNALRELAKIEKLR